MGCILEVDVNDYVSVRLGAREAVAREHPGRKKSRQLASNAACNVDGIGDNGKSVHG
jgi:hypothetical protein